LPNLLSRVGRFNIKHLTWHECGVQVHGFDLFQMIEKLWFLRMYMNAKLIYK